MAQPTSMVTVPFVSTDPTTNPGGIYLDNGSITSNGAGVVTMATMSGVASGAVSATTIAGGVASITATIGSTIAVTGLRVILAVPSGAAAATNLTLATGLQGQEITIINSNSTGSNTLVFTGNVVANVTISGATAAKLVYNSTLASWTKC